MFLICVLCWRYFVLFSGNRLYFFLDGDFCVDFLKKKLNILDFLMKLIYVCLILYFLNFI